MKIAFIGQKGIPAKLGGVEKHVEELATRLAQNGHEVFVYARNNYTDKNLLNYKNVKLVHLPSIARKNLDAISHTFLAIMHAVFQKYDIIHIHSIGPNSLNFILKILKPKTTLIATYHCQDYAHQKWGAFARAYLKLGEYMTCKIPDKTIVVSNVLKDFAKNRFGVETEMIPNGASISFDENSQELAQFNLEKNSYILAASRLIRHKGLHYLIAAFKNLEDKNLTDGKKLVIAGDGFYTDDYVKELKDLAQDRANIIFAGAQSGTALNQLFSHCHFFVQPSDSEGLSIALLEAMGYGRAVLVSDIAENMEAISDSGFSFKNGDAIDLENKMIEIMQDQEKLKIFGAKGKARVEQFYNWDQISKKTEGVYEKFLQ